MTALAITAALVLALAGGLVWGMRGRAERREVPLWPENAWPTPEQWVAWFLTRNHAVQVEMAERVLADAQRADRCFLMNHEGEIEYLRHDAHRTRETRA